MTTATVDIVTLTIASAGMIMGLARGPVKEIVSFAVALTSLVCALLFYPRVAALAGNFFTYPEAAAFFGFMTCFVAPVVTAGVIMFIVSRLSKGEGVSLSHRLIGGVLGLLRGSLIAGVLILGLLAFPLRNHPLDRSRVLPVALRLTAMARDAFPAQIAKNIEAETKRIEKGSKPVGKEVPVGRKQK